MEKTGFYCKICKSVPLIQIVPKEEDIKLFCMCKCHKKLINYDIFLKNYYQTNFDYTKISNEPIYNEYIDLSPRYNNLKTEINLEKINTDFNYIIEKINEYNLEIRNQIIVLLQNKINEIEKVYKQNKSNNNKLENIIKILISNYKSNEKNPSNIKNLLYNNNFNFGYKNDTYSTLNFNNYNKYLGLESLVKNSLKYLKSNYILSSYNEQIYTINTFFNHQKDVNCVTEVAPEIIASCSKDNYIILYNLERKKCIYKYYAHNDGVNWMLNINGKIILSCGGDCQIKAWPKINEKNLELVNSEKNGTTNTVELLISPLTSFNVKENIIKMIIIDNNYICACSMNNLFLIKYEIIEQNNNNEDRKQKSVKEILSINFNIIEMIHLNRAYDMLKVRNKKGEDLIVVNGSITIHFISIPKLSLITEIQNISDEKPYNNIIQINKDELLVSSKSYLGILDINKYIFKIKIKKSISVTCLCKLNDNTILMGTKEGMKRISLINLEEISLVNKIYSNNDPFLVEKFNYVYIFSDGRFAICSSHGNVKMCKFKIA